jgi:hypothetical protein
MKNNTKLILLLLSVAIVLLLFFTNAHLVTGRLAGMAGGTKTLVSLLLLIGALTGFASLCLRYRDMDKGARQ